MSDNEEYSVGSVAFCHYCKHPSCAGCNSSRGGPVLDTVKDVSQAMSAATDAQLYAPIPRVIAGLLRILNGEGAKKHGDEWKTRSDREEMCHIMQHEYRADNPEYRNYDDEGDPHELKSLCRRALKLERWLIAEEERALATTDDLEPEK